MHQLPVRSLSQETTKPRLGSSLKEILALFWDAGEGWVRHRCSSLGAALSCYILFSFIPLVVMTVALVSVTVSQKAGREFMEILRQMIGEEGITLLKDAASRASELWKNPQAAWATALSLSLGASGTFLELQDALNLIWELEPCPPRGLGDVLRRRASSFVIVLGSGLLLWISLVATTALGGMEGIFTRFLPELHLPWLISVVAFVLGVLVFATVYRTLPDAHVRWQDVWLGATITAVSIMAGKSLLWFALRRSALASLYGAAGSVVLFLLWIYYCSQIFFFGAELTRAWAQRLGSWNSKPTHKDSEKPRY
ncbi:YihY/virulence factor BrkB family protein [Candidatus Methylacidithermus pantelleriae]|uniref:Ribonuclease BN family enzyme n=1 Tax=Candidatus Methylacidithermus pantelleriae TaxID=2744239 RepID=A0A8J2FR23_9BACT|nr:YihY/virulence factor BrkB family protein [Candidatus Methylacidithermus pantelleriae]CAF0699258.1 Ribonuclease BN family enzyme [Candidatus Methylacidithermus pantelleriae]